MTEYETVAAGIEDVDEPIRVVMEPDGETMTVEFSCFGVAEAFDLLPDLDKIWAFEEIADTIPDDLRQRLAQYVADGPPKFPSLLTLVEPEPETTVLVEPGDD